MSKNVPELYTHSQLYAFSLSETLPQGYSSTFLLHAVVLALTL